jgi:hypothetical protein
MILFFLLLLAAADEKPSDLNLLGKADAQSGASKRNENVSFNLIDNNVLKDSNLRLGTTATITPVFEAQSNYFGTEFGNQPKPQIHIASRPGAGIHGTLFETHSNSLLSARTFFQVGAVLPARENNFGLTLSVPLEKFGYLTLEGSRQFIRGSVNGNVLVPKAGERSALTADPAAARLIERWLNAYPLAAPNRPDADERALNTNSPQSIDTNNASLRWQLGRLVFRHAWTTQVVNAFELVAGQNPDTATRSHTSRLSWERGIFAASLGFDRAHSELTPEPNAVGPQVQIGTAFTSLGPGSNIPLDRVINRYRGGVMVKRKQGAHNWHAGWETGRVQYNSREASSNRGNYYFRNDFGNDAITNFRLGLPSRYSTGIGGLDRGFRNWEQQYFAGDTWQVEKWLTINYGIRYEPVAGPREVNNLTPIPFHCDCNNWAPRFGFAVRLPGKAGVLRASYGLHYSEFTMVTLQQLRWDPPNFQKIEVVSPDLLNPLGKLNGSKRAALFQLQDNLRSPYSHQYNFSWETQFLKDWRLQLGYVGSRTQKIFYTLYTNRARVVDGIALTTATVNDRRPNPNYYDMRRVTNMSRAYFDAGRATLIAPSFKGLHFDASYWFSKAIDLGGNYLNTAAGDDSRNSLSQSEGIVQADLKGLSAFDQKHAALARVNYTLPRGVDVSAFWMAKTGLPFTVYSGSDSPGFGNSDGVNGDRPNLIDPAVLGRAIGDPNTSARLLPRSAFQFIPVGASRGSLGRSTFRRGGIRNVNASVGKTWKLKADKLLTLRAESFNLSNTPQFAEPNADLSSPAFGLITNTLNDGRSFSFTVQVKF